MLGAGLARLVAPAPLDHVTQPSHGPERPGQFDADCSDIPRGCVTADGPATAAAQRWGAYDLASSAQHDTLPFYDSSDGVVYDGAYESGTDNYVGFTWFPDSLRLVVSTQLP